MHGKRTGRLPYCFWLRVEGSGDSSSMLRMGMAGVVTWLIGLRMYVLSPLAAQVSR